MGATMEDILIFRETVIFLLQQLGVILNLEKSILNPVPLLKKKILKVQTQCIDILTKGCATTLKLTKLLGLLTLTRQAALPLIIVT